MKKPTGWLRNSPEILKKLRKRCQGRAGRCTRPGGGDHVTASGKVAREAAVYPFKLCRDILKGCMRQLQADGKLQPGTLGVHCLWEETADEVLAMTGKWTSLNKPSKDSVTGQLLPEELKKAGRNLEFEYFEKKCVWEKIPRSEDLSTLD